ncbi:MAG TPA: patatin-like phospholipase family protein [Leptospiraceae bacterium]|nr:patatin-like phospholipase family protein [Leptospiraceae bacterium]HMW06295.1 patatin-like phospholipase family protein [Leptospiraceae bacterium]HMX31026.1 patatin-like phospholipase family protein [Leptospiraceae bacterium]HMY32155.1 patatin-like phospholipase family protein [Leptospiraceae bacterium]HMZ65116.1 patatin-like phospholipase family protein [Leptospiraceae bacterium]
MQSKKQTAICLNSAFFGFYAHAGFVKGISELKFKPSFVSGCSAGAIVGALYASGVNIDEMISIIKEFKKKDFWEGNIFSHLIKPFRHGFKNYSGQLTGVKLKNFLHPFLGNKKIEDFPIRFGAATVNLTKRKREFITKGDAIDAILASSAFPLLFEVQKINGMDYTDGGLIDHEPTKELILDKSIHTIITHNVHKEQEESKYILGRAVSQGLSVIEEETRDLKDLLAKKYKTKIHRITTITPAVDPDKLHIGIGNIELGRQSVHKNAKLFK